MLRLAFDFIIAWREIRARPNAYQTYAILNSPQPTYVGCTVCIRGLYSLPMWAIKRLIF